MLVKGSSDRLGWIATAAVLAGLLVLSCAPPAAAQARVDTVIQRVLAAKTLGDAGQAIADKALTAAERSTLKTRLKQPNVAAHLERLRQQAVATAKIGAEKAGRQRVLQLNAQHEKALATRNRPAQAAVATMRSQAKKPTLLLRKTTLSPQMIATARAFGTSDANPASVTSVSPDPAVVGSRVTLSGRHLGASRGQVDLLLLTARLSVGCSVVSWSDTRVVATVPAGVEGLVGSSGEAVFFRVKPAGQVTGPGLETRLVSSAVPAITRISESTIEPGQMLIVEGAGFGPESGQARVQFASLGQTRDAVIDAWADAMIVLHLDEKTSGLPREVPCELQLTSASGRSASHSLTFHAALTYATLSEVIQHDHGDVYCAEEVSWSDVLFVSETLNNDWQVFASFVRLDMSLDSHYEAPTCEITSRPRSGSTRPTMTVRTVSGCYPTVTCVADVVISGPRGTWYRSGSVVPPI